MSVALASKGDSTQALDHLRRAITLNPENRALARQDPDLEPFRIGRRIPRISPTRPRDQAAAGPGNDGEPAPPRRPCGRQGNADEIRSSQGSARRRRPAADRARPSHRRYPLALLRRRSSSVTRPMPCRRRWRGRPNVRFALQEPQLGTGHALLQAEQALAGATGTVVLLSGDVPLLTPATLQALVDRHVDTGAAATVLTAMVDDPTGYGRIERRDGGIAAIVEHKDATPEQRQIREINSGIYAFDLAAAVRGAEADRIGERPGRVLPARPGADLPRPRPHGGDRHARRSAGDFRRQQPQGTGADWAALEDDQERRIDGVRRHHRRSGDRLHRSGRHHRARHRHSSERLSRGAHHDRLGLRDSVRGPHRQFDARGQRLHQQLLRDHRFARRQGRAARTVRAHPAGLAHRRGRARRQLRRAEEDHARPRLEGQSPRLSRRRA